MDGNDTVPKVQGAIVSFDGEDDIVISSFIVGATEGQAIRKATEDGGIFLPLPDKPFNHLLHWKSGGALGERSDKPITISLVRGDYEFSYTFQ